jgi:hypothetical protein
MTKHISILHQGHMLCFISFIQDLSVKMPEEMICSCIYPRTVQLEVYVWFLFSCEGMCNRRCLFRNRNGQGRRFTGSVNVPRIKTLQITFLGTSCHDC